MKYFSFFCFLIIQVAFGYSQTNFLDASFIKSVIFKSNSVNYFTPIYKLNEPFSLSFDDLNATEEVYTYKIEHCNLNWEVSNLLVNEFIEGYNQERIRDYENSFNTLQHYTHYKVQFPNNNTRFKITGNYILSVLNENDDVVLKRHFVLYNPEVTVGVSVHKSRNISEINSKQAIEFIVNVSNVTINNPNEEIYPVIIQNNNWQTAIIGLKPQFYRANQLLYKYNKETSFWAGNEFWYFDSKSIRNSTLNIAKSELGPEIYHTYLYTNEGRAEQPYTLYPDINGNYFIRTLDGDNSSIEADYSWVHFSLKTDADLVNKRVFVQGSFNNWQLTSENELTFNPIKTIFEAKILLKQGFYNYQFTTLNQNNQLNNYDIDGSFYQTENNYTVLVYYNKFGSRYPEVIGVGFGSSEKINN